MGLVRSVLSQLAGVKNEKEFDEKLVKGLASNYTNEVRSQLVKQICKKEGKEDNPLGFYIDQGKTVPYQD